MRYPSPVTIFSRSMILDIDTLRIICGASAGLDAEFECQRSYVPEPNGARVRVFNLSPAHRTALQSACDKGTVVAKIEAGYAGATAVIFSGTFDYVSVHRDGADVVTEATVKDGLKALAVNAVCKAYAKDTLVSAVLRDIAEATDLPPGNLTEAIATAQVKGVANVFKQPIAVHGNAYQQLVRVAASAGLEVSVQNGQLQFLAPGGALAGKAVLLSPSTGLIGSPTVSPASKKSGKILKCKTLIMPGLDPGRQIRLDAENVTGSFVVRRTRYSGSTFGQEWYADVEAAPL